MRKIRSQARTSRSNDSLSSSPQPRTSTPLPKVKVRSGSSTPEPLSREGTVFTPTADKELEAILNQDEVESTSGSASAKSRPATEGSVDLAQELQEKQEKIPEDEKDGQEQLPSEIVIKEPDSDTAMPPAGEINVLTTEDATNEQGVSSGKTLSIKQQLDLPRSKDGLLSPVGSFVDMKGSRLSLAQFSDRRSLISRESMKERQRLNMQVNSVYADLDARYADMLQHLMNIDKGLNTKGSSAESSSVVSLSGSNAPSVNFINIMNDDLIKGIIEEISATQDGDIQKDVISDIKTNETNAEENEKVGSGPSNEEGVEEEERDGLREAPEGEWNSFADTLSEDPHAPSQNTSYPSYEGEDENTSYLSTTGVTAHASEYEVDEDDERASVKLQGMNEDEKKWPVDVKEEI